MFSLLVIFLYLLLPIMEALKALYYDPKTGFTAADKLYRTAKKLKLDVSLKDVKDFLAKQNVAQQHKQVKQEKYYLPFKSPARNYLLQADLMFMDPALKTLNSNCYIILCVIDIFSRYTWCVALPNKEAETVLEAFKPIAKEANPTVVQWDGGLEFKNRIFKEFCTKANIRQEFNEPGYHNANAVIERFNGTLRRYLEKYMTAMKTKSWYKILPDIVQNYNNSFHSGINAIPAEAGEAKVADKIELKASGEISLCYEICNLFNHCLGNDLNKLTYITYDFMDGIITDEKKLSTEDAYKTTFDLIAQLKTLTKD